MPDVQFWKVPEPHTQTEKKIVQNMLIILMQILLYKCFN